MIKKILLISLLPVVTAVVVFLIISGKLNPDYFDLSSLPYYFKGSTVISITDEGFSPKNITVAEGTEITFINNGSSYHQPASNLHPTHQNYPEFDSKTPIEPGQSWKFKIKKNGTWFFHDHIQPQFGGKIKVVSFYTQQDKPLSWTKEQGKALMAQIEANENDPKRLTIARSLAYKVGPEIAIELLNESPITKFGETHLVAHVIGEVAYELYGDKALPVCQNDDLNGCSHGVVLTAISDVGLDGVRSMIKHCQTLAVFKNQMCLHATGHALTAEQNYDVFKAIELCNDLGDYDPRDLEHCYIGAFMENVLGDHNGLTPPDHPYLSETDLLLPCDKVDLKYQSACYLNQATWWYRVNKGDIKKTAQECSTIPKEFQNECADNIGRIVSTATKNDLNLIKTSCAYLTEDMSNQCITSIASSVFALGDENLPFKLCLMTTSKGRSNCWGDIGSLIQINNLPEEKVLELCQKIEPNYQSACDPNDNS